MTPFSLLPIATAVSLCFACGTALSATSDLIEVAKGEEYTQDIDIQNTAQAKTGGIQNNGTIKNDRIVMKNYSSTDGIFENNGSIETGLLDIFVSRNHTIGGKIIAHEAFIYRGTNDNHQGLPTTAEIDTPLLHIIGLDRATNNQVGLSIKNADVLKNVDAIKVESNQGRTGLVFDSGTYTYDGDITLVTNKGTQDARITSDKGAKVALKSVITEKGLGAIQTDNNSEISVESLIVENEAAVKLAGQGTGHSTITLKDIYLGKGSSLTAMDHSPNSHTVDILGDISLTLDSDAVADFVRPPLTGAPYETIEADLKADSLNVIVLDAHSDSKVLLSTENTHVQSDSITVTGAPSSNTGNAEADLNALGDIVQYATKKKEGGETIIESTSDIEGVELEQLANDLYDGATATVGKNGLENINIKKNTNILGIAEISTLGLHIWRNEINDMNKRLGELRDSRGQKNGIWARVYTGQAEIGSLSVENDYTAFQFGYDHQVVPNVFVGAAFSYTDGESDFSVGGGDNKIYALTAYGSYVADSGLFVDVTAKFGRLDNEFDIALADGMKSAGDYDANAFSMSAEAGWRWNATNLFFVEPQVEVMYGRVEDVDYKTSTGLSVHHDKAETLIGRAGLMLGLQCPDNRGNAYVRASVLHDFKGEADYDFSKNGDVRHLSNDLGGTWYEYGIGANFNVTPQTHLYADLEAASGGEVDTDYRVNLGVRYAF